MFLCHKLEWVVHWSKVRVFSVFGIVNLNMLPSLPKDAHAMDTDRCDFKVFLLLSSFDPGRYSFVLFQ